MRARARIGAVLRLGIGSVEDALGSVPDVQEDRLDARWAPERGSDLRAGDRHALAVGDHEQQPRARGRREEAAADDVLERLEPRRGRAERALRRRPVDPDRAAQRRHEDVVVDAREEVRQHPVGEGRRARPERRRTRRGSAARRRSRARSGSASRGRSGPASSETCRSRRTPPRPTAPCARTSIPAGVARPRARAARPRRVTATSGRRRASAPAPAARSPGAPRRRGGVRARAPPSGSTTARASSAPSGVSSVKLIEHG